MSLGILLFSFFAPFLIAFVVGWVVYRVMCRQFKAADDDAIDPMDRHDATLIHLSLKYFLHVDEGAKFCIRECRCGERLPLVRWTKVKCGGCRRWWYWIECEGAVECEPPEMGPPSEVAGPSKGESER